MPVVLIILDGFGISFEKRGNAIALAKTPNLKYISENFPGTILRASGIEVGLSWGEMGSSEVGHANIGAGLVVYQNLARLNSAIKDKSFFSLPAWGKAITHAKKYHSAIHLMGLVSNGGVHSHLNHLLAILEALKNLSFNGEVFIHIFTDGQDVAPQSALKFIKPLEKKLQELDIGKIATVSGRYYAMDKNENWDRIEKVYRCLIGESSQTAFTAKAAIQESYQKEVKDENIEPTALKDSTGKAIGQIKDNDVLIFFNFRADRARQLTQVFVSRDFENFPRKKINNLLFIPLATYHELDTYLEPAFPAQSITNPLARVIAETGKTQFHIAEKEKYAHVTYFFNGGAEKEFSGEDRLIIPSKNVSSYDLTPELSAKEITEQLVPIIKNKKYDFLVVNFANGDLVGHTGNLPASIAAIEVLDSCLGTILKAVLEASGTLVITADHGNVEEMINLETGEIDKEHSINPVPLWIVQSQRISDSLIMPKRIPTAPEGILADVAPTILEIMDIPKPPEMTGTSLLKSISYFPLPD